LAYSVFVIELRPDVTGKRAFAGKNADRREDKPCLYVGQTAKTPQERFAQHQNGVRSSRIVKEYGVRLRPRFYANVGPLETRSEAERAETRLAGKLRRRGYAVWSN
jgi:predicted GIY-YIG superfamily endonuclease